MKPFVKWAGGKTQLLKTIEGMLPKEFNHYFEPFIGGGALLLDLQPKRATINDINPELINLYKQVANNVDDLICSLTSLDKEHENTSDCKSFYYAVREKYNLEINSNSIEQAARFIYLNKHCFNGLYRVNSNGFFNVPFNNKKSGNSFEESNLINSSTYLKNTEILQGDFAKSVEKAKANDFVFFDSPYAPLNPASFTDYTKEGFGYEEHVRLSELYKTLSKKGVKCMLTNHNTDLINTLYSGFHIKVVQVSRNINSDASNRKGEEVIITNYEL